MPNPSQPTALIVGASRGLGHALAAEYLARDWQVVGTVRGDKKTPLHELAETSDGRLEIEQVDIDRPDQVQSLRQRLEGRVLDLLFVNAGVALQSPDAPIGDIDTDAFVSMMTTNALSPLRLIEQFGSLVRTDGTIAVMSSGLASVANNTNGTWEGYRASKAALNTLMRSYAARDDSGRTLLLMAPGWVRTDMGGSGASLSIEESIPQLVETVIAQRGHGGLRYLDRFGEVLAW